VGTARAREQILAELVSSNESIMLNLEGLRHRLARQGTEDEDSSHG